MFQCPFLDFLQEISPWLETPFFFPLLKFAPVETFEGGKRTLLNFQWVDLNGLVLKTDCIVRLSFPKN